MDTELGKRSVPVISNRIVINSRFNLDNIYIVQPQAFAMARSRLGFGAVGLLFLLSLIGWLSGVPPKVLGIAWVAFTAMAVGIPLGERADPHGLASRLVWGYGLASGAMITSAAVFLLPQAIAHQAQFGGFGVAAGVMLGYSAHTVGHQLTHTETSFEDVAVQLSAHSLAAGLVIGIVYAALPTLGPLFGLAIISHKGPAGYAAARRLVLEDQDVSILLLPAAGVGLTAIPAASIGLPNAPIFNALVFGFAAGIFLHIAMDFLPRCETGGEIYNLANIESKGHAVLDRLRIHSVVSTILGGIIVFLAWVAVTNSL